ncbi:hypothetical protein F5148DRAFT_496614 [Russula earlei]|uniref:Uncharacterized protein n=1 Tax=Russula earlei TaxID=71964 RepID=A0ACC0TXH9_9AGAM|nr:hypothetical protein F5148DRAFT_496614 [Russula earlei]
MCESTDLVYHRPSPRKWPPFARAIRPSRSFPLSRHILCVFRDRFLLSIHLCLISINSVSCTQSFKFDCDALYIETHSLHQEGKYQWALIFIDAQGTVTRLPLPKLPSRPTSRHEGGSSAQREAHAPGVPAQPNCRKSPRGAPSQLLGYCKIGAYVGGLGRSEFEEVGNAALREKNDGVRPTWLLHVLATLQERGRILWDGPVGAVEGRVLEINREADMKWLQAFLHSTPYKIYTTTVL